VKTAIFHNMLMRERVKLGYIESWVGKKKVSSETRKCNFCSQTNQFIILYSIKKSSSKDEVI
jgi:hypothetical protein